MRTYKSVVLLLFFGCLAAYASGQDITGVVYDSSSQQPIVGASIIAANNQQGTSSDADGKFSLDLQGAKSFQVSFVGYQTKTIRATKESFYRVDLGSSNPALDQVVVVGYGTQKKANLTGAVTTVDVTKTFQSKPLNDPTKALQGVVPGLTITYGNGGLTTAPDINIRGIGSINGGSKPLILVDNVETPDLSVINPNDIESVSVLKDAASTSIYGARAAFGVVLIKTKSGKRNQKTSVTYNNYFGWSKPTVLPDFANPVPELQALYDASQRAGVTAPELFGMQLTKLKAGIENWQKNFANNRTSNEMIENEDFEFIPSDNRVYFYRVWDPKDVMLKDYTNQQMHNIRIQGGSEKVGYYLSFGYSQDGGIMKMNPDNVKKYNITAAVNATVTKWMDVDVKMLYRNFKYESPYQYQSYWYYFWRWGAYFPFGTWNGHYFRHTPAYLAGAQTNSAIDNYQRVDIGTTLKLTKDLKIRADYTIGRDNVIRHEVGGPIMAWDFWSPGPLKLANIASASQDEAEYSTRRGIVNTFNAYAVYDKDLGDHNIKLTAGINAEDDEGYNFYGNGRGLLDPNKGELNLTTGTQTTSSGHSNDAYAGYFGRINYAYKDKYLLELNGRYDGTSAFASKDRWNFFSSASAGYRISEEDFMQFLKPTLNDLKFRVSYGAIGNQDLGGKYYIATMTSGEKDWILSNGGTLVQGINAPTSVASALTWEAIKTLDLGVDARLLKNHLGFTFDYFERNTEGMVAPTSVPETFGTGGPRTNQGNFRTRGWELSIDGNYNVTRDLQLYAIFTLADNKTVFTKWNNPSMLITQNYVGKTYGEIWGFETDRYFTSAEDVAKSPDQTNLQNGNFVYGPGDIKYKNLNGDSVISGGKMTVADPGDLKVIGNSTPRYLYSARIGGTWKGFDVDIFLQGVGKRDFWGIGDIALPSYRGADILYAHQLDYWTPENPDARYPSTFTGNAGTKLAGFPKSGNNFYPQTKYMVNLAYCRLKNVTIGYSLPNNLIDRFNIQKLRIYLSGQNLGEISDVGLPLDPEITDGESSFLGRTFPFQRTYSFGVQLTF